MLLDDLQYACLVQAQGLVLAAGYSGGQIYFEWSDDGGKTKKQFGDGSTRKSIAIGDAQQPAIEHLPSGALLVVLASSGVLRTYISYDWGETWTYLDAIS